MDGTQFREAAHSAIEDIISYFDSLHSRPVLPTIEPGYLTPRLPSNAPTKPEGWSAIQRDIEDHIKPGLTHWQSPNFMAFFPSTVTYPSMIGELYSAAFNAPAFNWLCSPACTELETVVLDWMARLFGLPASYLSTSPNGGGGVIQGSASEAVVTVMIAARERWVRDQLTAEGLPDGVPGREREREDRAAALRGKLVAVGSSQSHSSTQKAAIITGVRFRTVPATSATGFALTGAALAEKLREMKAEGLVPFYVTATMGTTSTCAVDRFEEIAAVKKQWEAEGNGPLWVHVDAAYAGSALVCDEYHQYSRMFAPFDSVDINLHKWLLTNFDASLLFVTARKHLTDALSITPFYLRNPFSDSGRVTDYRDWQIPLGRRFRALKIWFVVRTYGTDGLKAYVRKHIALGEKMAEWTRQRGDLLRWVAGPAFALNVVSVRPTRGQPGERIISAFGNDVDAEHREEANKVTEEVYNRINNGGEIYITSSMLDGVYSIRIVSANENTEEKYLKRAFDILVTTAEQVMDEASKHGVANGST